LFERLSEIISVRPVIFWLDVLFEPSELAAVAPPHPEAEPRLSEVMEVFGGLLVRFDERLAGLELKVKGIHDGRH
jgi:hypothetical protein